MRKNETYEDDLIRRGDAVAAIKKYVSEIYGIDLNYPEQWAENTIENNYVQGLSEATELIEDVPAYRKGSAFNRNKRTRRWCNETLRRRIKR